jgi:hypothetical protein
MADTKATTLIRQKTMIIDDENHDMKPHIQFSDEENSSPSRTESNFDSGLDETINSNLHLRIS